MCISPVEMRTESTVETPEYPQINVRNGEESSGSGPDSTKGLRTWHQLERNPERPTSNSNGDWPFLRTEEWVPEVTIINAEATALTREASAITRQIPGGFPLQAK